MAKYCPCAVCIVICFKAVQDPKADFPITETLSGMEISVRLLQSSKPLSSVRPSGRTMLFKRLQCQKAPLAIYFMLLGRTMLSRLSHIQKAQVSINSKPSGSVTLLKCSHDSNALAKVLSSAQSRVRSVRPLQ